MNTLEGMIKDLNKSELVADDGETDICTTSGELITALKRLQHYEDLEERFSSIFENLTLDDFINIFLKYIQEDNEEIRTGKILTNEDADKWNRWKSLEKSDRLVELKIACGQKVYTDDKTYNHGFEEYRVIDISLGGDMTYVAQSKSGFNLIFSDSDIGKTVFTTEEEAELVLGGEQHD